MSRYEVSFGGITLSAPQEWKDITTEVAEKTKPYTLSKTDGVGALQFSPALYWTGNEPKPTASELLNLAEDFGRKHKLGEPLQSMHGGGDLKWASISYHSLGDFIRVWFVSDGMNVALVTYVSEWEKRDLEAEDVQKIVSSLRFKVSTSRA